MLEIRERNILQAWLKTQPREVSMAIAARAVLQVLPMLNGLVKYVIVLDETRDRENLLPPLFYGIAMPRVVAFVSKHGISTAAARAADARATAAAFSAAIDPTTNKARAAVAFAIRTASGRASTTYSAAVRAVAVSADAAFFAADEGDVPWRAACSRRELHHARGRHLVGSGMIGPVTIGAIVAHKELAHKLKAAKGIWKSGGS